MIKDIMDAGERIIWEGKPDKFTYILGSPAMYVFAALWGAFDFAFIGGIFGMGQPGGGFAFFLVPFFLLHLMPVWIAVGGPVYRAFNWRFVNYVLTEKRVYVESGVVGRDIKIIELSDVHEPEVNVGIIEKMRGCGTIRLSPFENSSGNGRQRTSYRGIIANIADPYDVYKMIKQMALDIRSDIEFPNAMRPEENPGYNTRYTRQ